MLDLTTTYGETNEAESAAHSAMVEQPTVYMASGFFAPFAAMQEAQSFWRKSYGLSRRWAESLMKCRTAPEVIETNAKFGERAMTLCYSECWRVAERSALMGRQAVAPGSLALRDAEA